MSGDRGVSHLTGIGKWDLRMFSLAIDYLPWSISWHSSSGVIACREEQVRGRKALFYSLYLQGNSHRLVLEKQTYWQHSLARHNTETARHVFTPFHLSSAINENCMLLFLTPKELLQSLYDISNRTGTLRKS